MGDPVSPRNILMDIDDAEWAQYWDNVMSGEVDQVEDLLLQPVHEIFELHPDDFEDCKWNL